MTQLCGWCKEELFKEKFDKGKRNFCSRLCRLEYLKRENRRVGKLNQCVVCQKSIAINSSWFCSHTCHANYVMSPGTFCKLVDSTCKFSKAISQRRYLAQFSLGRKLTPLESIIMTCENNDCINMEHAKVTSKSHAYKFWYKVRQKNLKGDKA
jgi:hypothetical protein